MVSMFLFLRKLLMLVDKSSRVIQTGNMRYYSSGNCAGFPLVV